MIAMLKNKILLKSAVLSFSGLLRPNTYSEIQNEKHRKEVKANSCVGM